MQKYVEQLVADLDAAKANRPEKPNVRVLYPDHPALDYGLDYIAEWECAPQIPMNDLFGIDAVVFPDAERLTDAQVEQLVDAILSLWGYYNFAADVYDDVPIHLVYKALVNKWKNKPVQYVSEGVSHLEFCDYEPERCPWGMEYCRCKDFEDDDMDMEKYKMTPEQEAEWEKGVRPGGSWINPKLLDENGNFDPSKLDDFMKDGEGDLPF
jgi:hypothetical protein